MQDITTACDVCSTPHFLVKLSCGCAFCHECVLGWVQEQLKAQFANEEFAIVCPTGDERHSLPLDEILELTRGSEYENQVERSTLRMVLSHTEDTMFCPREGCDYAGWIRSSEKCMSPLECEMCGSTWKEEVLLPGWKRYIRKVYRLMTGQDESLSQVWKDLWARGCPGCSALIEKNGGCPHMVCYRCKLDFCWTCMRPHHKHDYAYCEQRLFVTSLVYLIFGTLLILKFLYLCDLVLLVSNYLFIFFTTGSLLAFGSITIGIAAECEYCLCRIAAVVIYIGLHYLVVTAEEWGGQILRLEVAAGACFLHCLLPISYVQHAF